MKASPKTTKINDRAADIEFYEVMQADLRQPYSSVFPEAESPDHFVDEGTPVGRQTAIVTLVALALGVALLVYLIVAGLRAAIA